MNEQQNEWTNEVFKSLEGMQKASPPPELFEKIVDGAMTNCDHPKTQISLLQAIAAIILVLLLNVGITVQFSFQKGYSPHSAQLHDVYEQPFISDFNIYQQ